MIYHKSVLLQEVISFLDPKPWKVFIDATVGGGGHTFELLRKRSRVLGIDQDPDAIAYVQNKWDLERAKWKIAENLVLTKGNFSQIAKIAEENGFSSVDGILLDLGVSSHQLEDPQRGFSFQKEGPLDMRMDKNLNITAYDLINNFEKRRLYEIFKTYGQEELAGPIAAAVCSARQIAPIASTVQLAKIVEQVYSRCKPRLSSSGRKISPATKTFQALRIVINSESLNLQQCLPQTVDLLNLGGRLVVISFHSLEDGIVKRFLKTNKKLTILTERPIGPTLKEIENNPRARSAKLRAAEKI